MNINISRQLSDINIIKNNIAENIINSNSEVREYETYNEKLNQKYLEKQLLFCQNQIFFKNTLLEKKIKLVNLIFGNQNFGMFVYKKNDIVSTEISRSGNWEFNETNFILSSLIYYAQKKNISKTDIYVVDIGANIGWFSIVLGKIGYNILSFEPSKSNYYILLKNFCLNKEINLTIINKGLYNLVKNRYLYHPNDNVGNAIIFSDFNNLDFKQFEKEYIKLTKLKYYIPYLKTKNLALIKLDIEGSEGKAIEGGVDLIIKYHIPFIFMEWSPQLLRQKGTEPRLLLEIFENNGYKLSQKGFLNKQYCLIDELLNVTQTNIYVIYSKFIE